MNSIIATIFSPRKASQDREAASSPAAPKSSARNKKKKRMSLPEQKRERSVGFRGILNDEDVSPIRTTSSKRRESGARPDPLASPTRKPRRRSQTGDDEAADEEHVFTFKRFLKDRWKGDSIEIEVEWEEGDTTWENEADLHQDAADALLEYWESRGGRPTNPENPEMFDIHAIREHSKDRKKLLVEWVGYGPKDATWVPRAVVEETAPDVVAEYWKTVKPTRRRRRRA